MKVKESEISLEIIVKISSVLIKLQKFEFLIHGMISHFNKDILSKTSSFKNLNPEIFLSESSADKKKRKQTLGQIFKVLEDQVPFFYDPELDELLHLRNEFIHNLWRGYLSSGKYDEEKIILFLERTENLAIDWTKVLRGLISVITKKIFHEQSEKYKHENQSKQIEMLKYEMYEEYFYNKFKNKIIKG